MKNNGSPGAVRAMLPQRSPRLPPRAPRPGCLRARLRAGLVIALIIALVLAMLYLDQDRRLLPEPTEPPLEELLEEPDQSQSHFPPTTIIFPGFHSMLSAHGYPTSGFKEIPNERGRDF